MSEQVSREPWWESVKTEAGQWREYFSYQSSELTLALGVITPFLVLFVAFFAPFRFNQAMLVAALTVLAVLCFWASRSQRGLPQFIRGLLFSFGMILGLIASCFVGAWLAGGTMMPISRDFGSQRAIQTEPVKIERFDTDTIV